MHAFIQAAAHRLRNEPVAVWGVVLAAAIGGLAGLGVSRDVTDAIVAVVSVAGVPVVRRKVTPVDALKALARKRP